MRVSLTLVWFRPARNELGITSLLRAGGGVGHASRTLALGHPLGEDAYETRASPHHGLAASPLRSPIKGPAPVASGNTRRPSGREILHGEHLGGDEQAGPARAFEVGRVQTDERSRNSRRLSGAGAGPDAGRSASLRCVATRSGRGYHCSPGGDIVGRDQVEPTIAIPVHDDGLGIHLRRRGASLDFGGRLDGPFGGIPAPASPGDPPLSSACRRRGCRARPSPSQSASRTIIRKRRISCPRLGRDAGDADQDLALGGESTVGPTPKPMEARLVVAAVVGARHQVEPPVAIDVRQLRTEVRPASAGRDPLVVAEFTERTGAARRNRPSMPTLR